MLFDLFLSLRLNRSNGMYASAFKLSTEPPLLDASPENFARAKLQKSGDI